MQLRFCYSGCALALARHGVLKMIAPSSTSPVASAASVIPPSLISASLAHSTGGPHRTYAVHTKRSYIHALLQEFRCSKETAHQKRQKVCSCRFNCDVWVAAAAGEEEEGITCFVGSNLVASGLTDDDDGVEKLHGDREKGGAHVRVVAQNYSGPMHR